MIKIGNIYTNKDETIIAVPRCIRGGDVSYFVSIKYEKGTTILESSCTDFESFYNDTGNMFVGTGFEYTQRNELVYVDSVINNMYGLVPSIGDGGKKRYVYSKGGFEVVGAIIENLPILEVGKIYEFNGYEGKSESLKRLNGSRFMVVGVDTSKKYDRYNIEGYGCNFTFSSFIHGGVIHQYSSKADVTLTDEEIEIIERRRRVVEVLGYMSKAHLEAMWPKKTVREVLDCYENSMDELERLLKEYLDTIMNFPFRTGDIVRLNYIDENKEEQYQDYAVVLVYTDSTMDIISMTGYSSREEVFPVGMGFYKVGSLNRYDNTDEIEKEEFGYDE